MADLGGWAAVGTLALVAAGHLYAEVRRQLKKDLRLDDHERRIRKLEGSATDDDSEDDTLPMRRKDA